ncbi:MAG: hypothetical protein V3U37_04505 [Nitrospinaceae bacterium]
MVEQILETVMETVERFWLKLNLLFDLENSELFQALKPHFLNALKDPLVLVFTLIVLFSVPYGLYKMRKINADREEKLDRLIEEMEEEEATLAGEEEKKSKPLFPQDKRVTAKASGGEKVSEAGGLEDGGPDLAILEKLAEEESGAASVQDDSNVQPLGFDPGQPADTDALAYIEPAAASGQEDAGVPESQAETFSAVEKETKEIDSALKELMGEDFEAAEMSSPRTPTLPSENREDETRDQEIRDLQAEMEETINKLTEQLDSQQGYPPADLSTSMEPGDEEMYEDPAIKDLNEEMEQTISKLAAQIESSKQESEIFSRPPTLESGEMELEPEEHSDEEEQEIALSIDEIIEGSSSDELEAPMEEPEPEPEVEAELEEEAPPAEPEPEVEAELEEEAPPAEPEISMEEFEPEPEVEIVPEAASAPDIELEAEPASMEAEAAIEEPEIETVPEPELQPVAEAPAVLAEEPAPREVPKAIPSEKVDQLIGRLENLQEHLANRFQSIEPFGQEPAPRSYYQEKPSSPPTEAVFKKRIISDKEYLDTVESFIFMANQKKRK